MINKRGQISLEFVLVLVFGIIIITFIMYGVGIYLLNLEYQDRENRIDDIAQRVLGEFEVAERIEDGYKREYIIESHIIDRYNVTLNETGRYMLLHDVLAGETIDEARYYIITGSVAFEYERIDIDGREVGNLTIFRPDTEDFSRLELE